MLASVPQNMLTLVYNLLYNPPLGELLRHEVDQMES